MTKNFFIFLVLIIFVGGAIWLLLEKGEQANPSPTPTQASSSPTASVTAVMTTTLPNGLKIEDLKVGTGAEAKVGSAISVHYVGTFQNGQKFDSSYDRGQPATFSLIAGPGGLIQGWVDGIAGMKVGGKRKLTIPPALAYGASGIPAQDTQGKPIPGQYFIPPNSTLIFEVELLAVGVATGQ